MSFDFASAKAQLRRAVHNTLGVVAFYTDDVVNGLEIKARWHNKIDRFGDPLEQGYAEVVQGIDRIILFPDDHPGIEFKRKGQVYFPKYGLTFVLQVREPRDGVLSNTWQANPL